MRQQVYEKCNRHCGYCGTEITLKQMQVDHIIPQYLFADRVEKGFGIPTFLTHLTINDVNHMDNLMPTCRSCNNYKSSTHLELFRSEIQKQPERLRANKPTFRLAERFGLIQEINKTVTFYFETL